MKVSTTVKREISHYFDTLNTEEFIFGSAVKFNNEYCQYGLYEGITQTFGIVHNNPLYLYYVKNIFSSRFNFELVKLSSAWNFNKDLIDNSCYAEWSINSDELSVLSFNFNVEHKIHNVQELVPRTCDVDNKLLLSNLEYLMYTVNIVNVLDDLSKFKALDNLGANLFEHNLDISTTDYDHKFNDTFLDLPIKDDFFHTKKFIFDILYTEFDLNKAKQRIQDLLS
jgi:hypothetical protein